MDCTKFESQISEYLDGSLSKSDAAHFAAHVLQCRPCHSLMDDIRLTLVEVKDEIDLPDELENSLFSIQTELTPLSCQEFQELITDFLDGFVPAQIYHKFETHAEECGDCSGLLTEVVYAVAACHSVHTFEEIEIPESLECRLLAVSPAKSKSLRKSFAEKIARVAAAVMPRNTQTRAWNYATASGLAFAMLALMFIGVSDDGTVSGLFYGVQSKAATLYSRGTELYARQYEVIAEFKKVRSDIGEMWQTLGGETEFDAAHNGQPSTPKAE